MFLVTKCLARLTGLASNYGVGFSPVGNCLMHCSRLGLPGICCNQQEAWALLGRDRGTCSGFSLSFRSVPGISRLWPVNHGRGDDVTRRRTMQQFNPIFTNVWCPHRQENTFFDQVSVRHTSQELFSQDPTSLQCQVSLFPVAFICFSQYTRNGFFGNFNPKFAISLIDETENAFYCIHIWGATLLSL